MKTPVVIEKETEYTRAEIHAERYFWETEIDYLKSGGIHTYWSLDKMKEWLKKFDAFYWQASTTLISMLNLKDGVRTIISQYNQTNPESKIAWHISDQLM